MMEMHGKIYVVVAVLAIVFAGLGLFLFYLDRKLLSLEKKIDKLDPEKQSDGLSSRYKNYNI
jgi:CcmD family protein